MISNLSSSSVKINGVERVFYVLEVFPFSSERKSMSIVLRCDGV